MSCTFASTSDCARNPSLKASNSTSVISRYHEDEFLLEAQIRWQGNWDLKVKHVPPKELQQMLDIAYSDEISARKWETLLPELAGESNAEKPHPPAETTKVSINQLRE